MAHLPCALLSCVRASNDPRADAGAGRLTVRSAPKRPSRTRCPLTGEAPPKGVDLDRPAVAVKIENSPQARPQHGLENADLVFEEIVEGGITRFMAIYHCGVQQGRGPVRSARFDDPKIARPFTRVIAYSGSNGLVDKELQKRNMIMLNELNQRGAFYPCSPRRHPGPQPVRANRSAAQRPARPKGRSTTRTTSSSSVTFRRGRRRPEACGSTSMPRITIEYRWRGRGLEALRGWPIPDEPGAVRSPSPTC